MPSPSTAAGVAIGVLLLTGCTEKPAPAPAAPVPPPVIAINASDFAFQMPDTIAGGLVTLRISNAGQELHHAAVYRLDDGKTVADLANLKEGEAPTWLVPVGGPNAAMPGGAVEGTLNLRAGNYVVLCEIPSADGKLHLMKGMVKPLTVTAATVQATPPEADITMNLADFTFALSKEITAGRHTFRVETAAGQPHEVVVVRLQPGKKAEDVFAWAMTMVGPPPVEGIVGGTTALGTGDAVYFTGDFTPGEYGLICFLPDLTDGKPHAMHGMVRTLTVM